MTGRAPDELDVVVAVVVDGLPDAAIVREAEARDVALIAVGNHASAAVSSLGDVAAHVLRHARTSVLVARAHASTARIVAATDLPPASAAAMAMAAEATRLTPARLLVVCNIRERVGLVLTLATFGATAGFVDVELTDVHDHARRT